VSNIPEDEASLILFLPSRSETQSSVWLGQGSFVYMTSFPLGEMRSSPSSPLPQLLPHLGEGLDLSGVLGSRL
jgi:hypothetical protein